MLRVRGAVLLNVTCTGHGSREQQGKWSTARQGRAATESLGASRPNSRERHSRTSQQLRCSRYLPPTPTPIPTTHLALDVGLGLLQRRLRRQLLLHQCGGGCLRLLGGAGHGAGSRGGDDTLGGQALQTAVNGGSEWYRCRVLASQQKGWLCTSVCLQVRRLRKPCLGGHRHAAANLQPSRLHCVHATALALQSHATRPSTEPCRTWFRRCTTAAALAWILRFVSSSRGLPGW